MEMTAKIQQLMEGFFPDLLGVHFIETGPDRVRAQLHVRRDLCTPNNTIHGGAIMAFADTLGAVGTLANLADGSNTTTIESKTNFLRTAQVDGIVTGESKPLHRGKTTMVWQTKIADEAERAVAIVIQTQLVLTPCN